MKSTFLFADLPISVAHQYSYLEKYASDYIYENKSEIELSIETKDIEKEKKLFSQFYPNKDPSVFSDDYCEFIALQRKLSEIFPLHNRLLFHGSALSFDGNGILFTAKSGTGKSTHAKLWREAFQNKVIMINDDKPFLHIKEEGTAIYGSPWDGKHHLNTNSSFPLKAICILSRDESNHINEISKEEAYPALYQQIYKPENQDVMMKTLSLFDLLLDTVKVFQLNCNMEKEAAYVACEGLKEILYETE